MIHDWRAKFAAPKLPFYFVVLAPCDGHKWCGSFVNVRNAQMAGLRLPNTGYAVAVDLGDTNSPARSVHPRRKQEVSRRLALQALKLQYGKSVVAVVRWPSANNFLRRQRSQGSDKCLLLLRAGP